MRLPEFLYPRLPNSSGLPVACVWAPVGSWVDTPADEQVKFAMRWSIENILPRGNKCEKLRFPAR